MTLESLIAEIEGMGLSWSISVQSTGAAYFAFVSLEYNISHALDKNSFVSALEQAFKNYKDKKFF